LRIQLPSAARRWSGKREEKEKKAKEVDDGLFFFLFPPSRRSALRGSEVDSALLKASSCFQRGRKRVSKCGQVC